jgi:hypothetical protein
MIPFLIVLAIVAAVLALVFFRKSSVLQSRIRTIEEQSRVDAVRLEHERKQLQFEKEMVVLESKQALADEKQRLSSEFETLSATLVARNKLALKEAEAALDKDRQESALETERLRQHLQSEARRIVEEMTREVAAAQEEVRRFSELQSLGKEEADVRAALHAALREAEELKALAQEAISSAKAQAIVEKDDAITKAKGIRLQAERLLHRATSDAARIVEEAHKKAETIGGDAYLALRERDQLSSSLSAIRNIIDGYGDRYIIPSHSIIDDLAGDFAHTDAGQSLLAARATSRKMVEEGQAAECDYSERSRRETAIRFAVDAFNGRVDSILTEVGSENVGTLDQQIRDTFNLVNLNGAAFRNARILPFYLDARLAELKWAAAAHELKLKEREEQLRIREQIREEERARREFEKALKEAQREEEVLKQALEKARKQVEAATAEEKARLERQMADLSQKLAEAEARSQRATSMAQQTRKGNVYIISNFGSFGEGVFKIGMTRRLEPMERIWELGDASVPFEFDVHAIIPSDDAPALEGDLHDAFEDCRLNHVNLRKEFFRVPLERVRAIVAERKIEATFTMAAEAHEYRESKVIAAMKPEDRERYRMTLKQSPASLVVGAET